jgi:hypothetical protein
VFDNILAKWVQVVISMMQDVMKQPLRDDPLTKIFAGYLSTPCQPGYCEYFKISEHPMLSTFFTMSFML